MHNLYKTDIINNKFALLNSGEYLMKLDEVQEILEACKLYLETWRQNEIEIYNEDLLAQRQQERNDTSKYRQLLREQKEKRENRRFLYIIHNKRNGLYKIGLSINPIKRERTLQAEEPEIEIIETFKGGFELEKNIHNYFVNKRVRGEWFKLDDKDISVLKDKFFPDNKTATNNGLAKNWLTS